MSNPHISLGVDLSFWLKLFGEKREKERKRKERDLLEIYIHSQIQFVCFLQPMRIKSETASLVSSR